MTMSKDDRPWCRSWKRLRAGCAVVAVVIGLSQALAAHNGPVSPVPTGAHVELRLADLRQGAGAPGFLTSLWNWLFGGAEISGCTGCGANSPLIDGAAIVTLRERWALRVDSEPRSRHRGH